jgi:hypothetical protein
MKTAPGSILIAEAALFPEKEYISGIFVAVQRLGLEEDVLLLLDRQSLQQASLHSVEGVICSSLHLSITWSRIFSVK